MSEIDCNVMRVILAESEYDPDALFRIELRLQGAIWAWVGDCHGYELLSNSVNLDEGFRPLLSHGMRKGGQLLFL